MNNSEFFGRGSINKLNNILFDFGVKRILLVTGKSSYDNCPIKEKVESNLKSFTVHRYSDFAVNPMVEDLIKGVNLVETFNPDAIVAIGGGSVLDSAKMLSFLPANNEAIIKFIKGEIAVTHRKKKLILIPTTAGSGSEATHFAVAYIDKVKYSIASKYLLPDAIILDPEFTDTMPKELTAITTFDAFCQAIESFWSVGATKTSKNYAMESIGIILATFENLIDTPTRFDRDKMMHASFLAGKAINISKTTAPHALSYTLTKKFFIPHGLAVMLLLPAFFNFNTNFKRANLNTSLNFNEYVNRIDELKTLMGIISINEAIYKINKMILSAGFMLRLRDYGVNKLSDIKLLADSINIERLNNNPVIINKAQLISLLETIY